MVNEVLEVRHPAAGRRGSQLEVKVRWEGQWREHQCEWVPVTWLNMQAKQQARSMEEKGKGKRGAAGEEERGGRRVSPRVAGEVPVIGLPGTRKRQARIEGGDGREGRGEEGRKDQKQKIGPRQKRGREKGQEHASKRYRLRSGRIE